MARGKLTTCLIVLIGVLIQKSVSDEVVMNINGNPSTQVVLGSSIPLNTSFTCTISNGGTGVSIDTDGIYNMQILRKRENDFSFDVIGDVKNTDRNNPAFVSNAPSDIVSRGSMTGGIDANTPTSSSLTLTLLTTDVRCTDKGTYQCKVVYSGTDSNVYTPESNATLDTYALPHDLSLTASKNGVVVQGTGPGDSAADFNVYEVVVMTCSAKIGSDNTTKIRWKRTSEFNDMFIPYSQQTDFDDGTASSMQTDCSYTRTATLNYNVTMSDTNRDNQLAFQCYISVTPPGQNPQDTVNPPTFYINPINPNAGSGNAGQSGVSSAGSDTGAIVGGVVGGIVLIVLIVLLVYFLWYRRRGDGSTYRTKEETGEQNPNMVSGTPSVDPTYAVPNKEKKRGHENKGLEDRHTNRRRDEDRHTNRRSNDHYDDIKDNDRYYNNNSSDSRDRGRANYGLDDEDDYSRDGSPTINHMGLDPESGSYGTGV